MTSARAADVTLIAHKVVVKDKPTSGKAVVVSKDAPIPLPTLGGSNDPTLLGATFRVFAHFGESATMAMPSENWTTKDGVVFKYRNPDAPGGPSPVRTAVLKEAVFKVNAKASGITLDEFFQDSIVMELKVGDTIWCAIGSFPKKDQPGIFIAGRQEFPPGFCLPFSPSGAFLD